MRHHEVLTASLIGSEGGVAAVPVPPTALGGQPLTDVDLTRQTHSGSVGTFARHFLEMFVAMIVGMGVGGGIDSLAFSLLGLGSFGKYVAVLALLMPTNMTLGMAVWMRHRGHSWERIGEMAVPMYLPFLALLGPYFAGIAERGAVMGGGHMLMLPLMLGVMLARYREYSQDHKTHAHGNAPETAPSCHS